METLAAKPKQGPIYGMATDEMRHVQALYERLLAAQKPWVTWYSGTYTGAYCNDECKDWESHCDLPVEYWNDYVYAGLVFDWDGMEPPTGSVELRRYENGNKTAVISAPCCAYGPGAIAHTKFKFVATLRPVAPQAVREKLMKEAMRIHKAGHKSAAEPG